MLTLHLLQCKAFEQILFKYMTGAIGKDMSLINSQYINSLNLKIFELVNNSFITENRKKGYL